MKKTVIIASVFAFVAVCGYFISTGEEKAQAPALQTIEKNPHQRNAPASHGTAVTRENTDCSFCHDCDYPTATEPCLKICPRPDLSVYHSSIEGPVSIPMSALSKRYAPVAFSHKLHSEMPLAGKGCTECHHYNTKGPIVACRKCHEAERNREDIGKPDLTAAYHRRCLDCHRQMDPKVTCNYCHRDKNAQGTADVEKMLAAMKGKSHSTAPSPGKILYQTASPKGKVVTFYHDEHVGKFKIPCSKCHTERNCFSCHNGSDIKSKTTGYPMTQADKKAPEEHHKPCSSCHDMNNCSKCHADNAGAPFDHSKTGFALVGKHSGIDCAKCHKEQPIRKVSRECTACHDNFVKGKFDHKRTGLALSDIHTETADCNQCHQGGKFDRKPVCKECHDDKSYPKDMPGEKVTVTRKKGK